MFAVKKLVHISRAAVSVVRGIKVEMRGLAVGRQRKDDRWAVRNARAEVWMSGVMKKVIFLKINRRGFLLYHLSPKLDILSPQFRRESWSSGVP